MSVHFALDPAMTDADWDAARRLAAAMQSTATVHEVSTERAETEPETSAK